MSYYTYIHATPDGDVFYVGKGIGRRAYSMRDRSWIWQEKFKSLDGVTMKIVKKFATEAEAFEHEKELIKYYKDQGCNLVNQSDGGLGPTGYKFTEKRKKSISEKMRGYRHKAVTCPHCGDTGGETSMKRWHFDNCTGPTKKFKARVTINGERIHLGKFATKEEAKTAVEDFYKEHPKQNVWLGRKHSDASRKKMSEAHIGHLGNLWPEEAKQKMAKKRTGDKNPFYGRKHTEDARRIIGNKGKSRKGYWAGKSFSGEHISKLKINRTCPHCGINGSGSAMNRWHMDNCKFKTEAA